MKPNTIYSNCKLFSINGEFLSYISARRMEWYLKKNLAEKLSDTEIQLLFEHSGKASQPKLYTEIRENLCVVCGAKENLTKHHIVPYAFKKHFPLNYKNRTSFDVAVLCIECHESYERHADELKKDLLNGYEVSASKPYELGIANTLLYHRDSLPDEVYLRMAYQLPNGVADSDENLRAYIDGFSFDKKNPSEELVKKLESIGDFIITWRKHFVQYAQPKHMPQSWYDEIEFVYSK